MALGKPVINIPRGKEYDPRAVAAAFDAANKRIEAIEDVLNNLPTQVLAAVMQSIQNQANGVLVKTGPDKITTRKIQAGSGVSVANPDGVGGNPTVSSP